MKGQIHDNYFISVWTALISVVTYESDISVVTQVYSLPNIMTKRENPELI